MTEEKQNNPKFEFKSIKLGESVEMTLESPGPIATGESSYGIWTLWVGSVTNATVIEGKRGNEKVIPNYTGKVIFFPAKMLNKKLLETTNGNIEVKIKVTKSAKEAPKGLITEYLVEKLSNGRPNQSSITPTEAKLVEATNQIIKEGFQINKDLFIKSSQEPQYENRISVERSEELYKLVTK